MQRMLAATRAELLQLETVRSVTTILRRDVVALLAHRARQRDAWANIIPCHITPLK